MAKCDLYMERSSDAVRYHYKHKPVPRCRNAEVEDLVAKPVPEGHLPEDLEVAVPPCWSLGGCLAEEKVLPGADVEVEATQEEDRVVEPVLMGDCEAGEGVEVHDFVVVR